MSNQVSANRGVPAVKLPSVREPGDPAWPEVRGPACAGEGRGGGTGDGGRGETGGAGSEEGRPVEPDPGEERQYLCGDGEGNRLRGEVGRRSKPTGIGWWRVELELDKSQMRSSSSEPLAGAEVKREVPPDPDSKMLRGSTSLGEGKVGISATEAVDQLRSSFGDQRPPALSGMRSGYREGFFSPSGHFVEKQRSPTHSSQLIRKAFSVSSTKKPRDIDRFVQASDLVERVNKLSRQKSGGFFDMSGVEFSGNCPLCELECHCLGPSCLQRKGISDIVYFDITVDDIMHRSFWCQQ